jgi:hypothetical protein
MSGRTIHGEWKQDGDYRFLIEGEWSWMNGESLPNDRRKLVITLQPPFLLQPSDESKQVFIPRHMKSPPKIYKCYFTIDELVKMETSK